MANRLSETSWANALNFAKEEHNVTRKTKTILERIVRLSVSVAVAIATFGIFWTVVQFAAIGSSKCFEEIFDEKRSATFKRNDLLFSCYYWTDERFFLFLFLKTHVLEFDKEQKVDVDENTYTHTRTHSNM